MYTSRIDITPAVREQVIVLLQTRLVDAVDLFTQVKQAHWNVKGPSFIAMHELFDKVAETVEEHSDLIAERITALGGRADATARVAAAQSSLAEYPLDIVSDMQHVAAVADRLAAFGKAVRADIDRAAVLNDAGSSDLLTQISRDLDKHLWLVQAHLQASR